MRSSIVLLSVFAIAASSTRDAHAAAALLDPAEPPVSEISFADFNGDGKPDMIVREFATGNLSVYLNQGDHFTAAPSWVGPGRSAPDGVNWDTLYADINGDGKADSIDRSRVDGSLCVHLNVGNDFAAGAPCYAGMAHSSPQWKTFVARIDGDARDDRIDIDQSTGTI